MDPSSLDYLPHCMIVAANAYAGRRQRPPDLVQVLVSKSFAEAEDLIINNQDPEYLNRGAYDVMPILLVVSGAAGYRNFRLAKLLVEKGADVNPLLCLVTPLEHLVNLFLRVEECSEAGYQGLPEMVIGLDGRVNPPLAILKAELVELIDVFLAHDARPIRSQFYRLVAAPQPDVELVVKLLQAGASLAMGDGHGTTPLMGHIAAAPRDAALPLVERILGLNTRINLDAANCCHETMLWRAMLAGSPAVAIALLESGADPGTRVPVDFVGSTRRLAISPLFAPLLRESVLYEEIHGTSSPRVNFSVTVLDRVMSPVFYVVDRTDICERIFVELHSFLSWKTNFSIGCMRNREISEHDIPVLMLGLDKCGLQQLCVRAIMRHLLVNRRGIQRVIARTVQYFPKTITPEVIVEYSMFKSSWLGQEWMTVVNLCPERIEALVTEYLRLPRLVMERFFIEAARYQLAAILYSADFPGCRGSCHINDHWAGRIWFDRRERYVDYSSEDSSDGSF